MLSRVACCPELVVLQILCFSDVPRESVYFRFALFADSLPMENVCCRGWRAVLNWLSSKYLVFPMFLERVCISDLRYLRAACQWKPYVVEGGVLS